MSVEVTLAYMSGSEDSFRELVLSFHRGLRDDTQVSRLLWQGFPPDEPSLQPFFVVLD